MTTYRDLIVGIVALLWLTSNLTCYFIWGENGSVLSNMAFILLFGSVVLIKSNSKPFNQWLNKKL